MLANLKHIVLTLLLIIGAIGGTVVMMQQQSGGEELVLDEPTPESTATLAVTTTLAATKTPAPIVVFVSGEVHSPGVYTLPPGSRIVDAIQAAGGATEKAAIAALNQATLLSDGVQIHMPAEGEEPMPEPPSDSGGGFNAPSTSNGSLVHINRADATTLQTLPGIGPALATRIIEHRTANGPFASIEQLKEVKGIGDKLIDKIRDLIVFD